MEVIRNYINAIFSSLPKTPEVLRLQAEMMENMEDKYNDLLREGKSENEAIGIVIASIGSAEELKAGFDIPDEPEPADYSAFFAERAAFHRKFAVAIAVGVVLCICGVLFAGFADGFTSNDSIITALFFVPIAIAVAIFVYFGIRENWYEQQYKEIQKPEPAVKDAKSLSGLVASILFPLAAMLYLWIGFQYRLWHPGWIIFPVCGIIVGGISAVENFKKQ